MNRLNPEQVIHEVSEVAKTRTAMINPDGIFNNLTFSDLSSD